METKTKTNRLARRIQASLAGKSARQATVRATLTGPAAETWIELRLAAEDLEMDDRALLAALIDAGAFSLRKALSQIPRS